ncbi:glycine cleavage system protein GcvH [Paenibacillus radicis (ex Xue et al. 2023)]|uniref:Glycine cleavage system H protein n=1 Tax=Paenibacillus radicis (ex Xue et al. 2023) TaxID=2972489 RepID=A0ABT1YUV0_9BACL|nr:glycine cleavage system protein GcvH [Paenibacillus radicis (ex Xue et al. 2023)]MCR8636733.1 glycine cleavage system protein GcvH [Paenibacillus radicis (ex Xue et al. 2023)]
MSEVKDQLLYSKEHEWAEVIGDRTIRIGISDFAQHQLGDIVFLELPEVGAQVNAADSLGSIESVKTVSDLYSPVKGTVTKVNSALIDQPELVNEDPYEGGWMVEIEIEQSAEEALENLLSAEQYKEFTEDQE